MKIVIAISHSFCGNFIRGQAAYLRGKGCEVIIVSAGGPEVTKISREEGPKLVEIPFSRDISLFSDFKCFMSVIRFLKEEKPDIVNAGNPKTGFLFMLASIFFPKITMLFTLRGLRSDTLSGAKRAIVTATEWLSCYLAKRVIVISPSLKEHAIQRGILRSEKAIVIGKGSSNGVDTNIFQRTESNRNKGLRIRTNLNIAETDIVVGYVGRITKDKGIEELYHAFEICRAIHPTIKLILTGPVEADDPISELLMEEMLKNKSVSFLGKQRDVTGIYAAYNILVLCSHREGFGNVVLEASAMGLPTIVSNIPGLKDTTEHMCSGIIVPPHSSKDLANAIMRYIIEPKLRLEHGEYGIKRAQLYFSTGIIWDGQYQLYKTLTR